MENSILRTLKNFSLMERQIPICRILFMRVAFSSDGCNSDATLMQPYKTVSLLSTVAKKPTGRTNLPVGFFIEVTDAEPLHFAEMENPAL